MRLTPSLAAAAAVLLAATRARAAECGETGEGFQTWVTLFKKDALDAGIEARVFDAAMTGVAYDEEVIELDRTQRPFKQSAAKFLAQRVTKRRITRGRELLERHEKLFAKIEDTFGVPPPVVAAIWGLETDYGRDIGNKNVFRSLATLAYDCRRTERFQRELLAALRLVQRGDLTPGGMRGAWAGELGQTQFLPSSYERMAVDFDGDGRRDLLHTTADVLASTANYLHAHGWTRGQGWKEGSANWVVLGTWNKSPLVQKSIVVMANRLAQ